MYTVVLKTNLPEFFNDISDEIRLFLDMTDIVSESTNNADYIIDANLSDHNNIWTATAYIYKHSELKSVYIFDYTAIQGDEIVVKRHKKRCIKIAVFRALKKYFPDNYTPWGSLTGIRPTKLLRELECEFTDEESKHIMTSMFDVTDKKYQIAKQIVDIQMPIINSVKENDIDIYIGIPYCKTKCLYCSFPSGIRTDKTDMRSYINALKHDIEFGAKIVSDYGYNIRCSYMGGGTPTVLTEDELYEVLEHAQKCYGSLGHEITVEAGRPDTITSKKLKILHDAGVNRISINPQTMNDSTLELIGRSHTSKQLEESYYCAKDFGFAINMDMIIGLPSEGISEVENTLNRIEDMKPDNLTVHTLALKKSSRLIQLINDKKTDLVMPDAELADTMVEMGLNRAKNMGMQPYYMYRQKYMRGNLENIGYSMPGMECVYNIDMMEETVSIMSHGAGSMSKRIFDGRTLRVERIANPKDITTYISKADKVIEDKINLFKR